MKITIETDSLLNKKMIENARLKKNLRSLLSVITIDQQGTCWMKKDAVDQVRCAKYLIDHIMD
jgi:hypothetical protein